MAWQIQIANSNNRVLHQSSLKLGDVIRGLYYWKVLFHYFLLHFRELYYNSTINVYNLKIFLQFEL